MKTGFRFFNEGTEYTVVLHEGNGKHDIALLLRQIKPQFLTVRDLTKTKEGYSWYWSHFFNELDDAIADYKERHRTLKS